VIFGGKSSMRADFFEKNRVRGDMKLDEIFERKKGVMVE
jgi:hypothetical protein